MHGRRAETKYLMSHFKHYSRSILSSISKCVKSVRRFNGMRSFGVNSTEIDHEPCSIWWNNLINTNMRKCVGQVTKPLACLLIRQANDCDHEEGSCEVQDQDLR